MAEKDTATSGADTATLQAQVDKLTNQLQTWQAKATDYEKRFNGIDPEAVKAMREDYELLRKEGAVGDKAKIEKLIADKSAEVENRFKTHLTERDQKISTYEKELKTLRVTNIAMQEAAKKFNADQLPLLQREIDSATDFVDGKIVILENGKPAYSKKNPSQLMDLPEYMDQLAAKYPSSAKSSMVAGGQTSGTTYTNGSTRLSTAEFMRLTQADQTAYIKSLPQPEQRTLLNNLIQSR